MSLRVWKIMQRGKISIINRVLFVSPEEVQEVMGGGGGRQMVPKGCAELTGRHGAGSSRDRCCLVVGCAGGRCSQTKFLGLRMESLGEMLRPLFSRRS